jgi:hypothetical protein
METDAEVDAFVRRQIAAGRRFAPITDAPGFAESDGSTPGCAKASAACMEARRQS